MDLVILPNKPLTLNIVCLPQGEGPQPTEYNGRSILKGWKAGGGIPKVFTVVVFKNMRVVECLNGYVLLCSQDGCKNVRRGKNIKCKSHSEDGESYLRCRDLKCGKHAIYGYEYKKPLFCGSHRFDGMINVVNKRCEHNGCIIRPNFGYEGQSAIRCGGHKSPDMVDVKHKRCEHHGGCDTQPCYGYEGHPARFCVKHKEQDMIDVKSQRCLSNGCKKQPCFGYEGGHYDFCFEHKLDGMIDVKNMKCINLDCHKRANFGYEGDCVKFCTNHKAPGMIDIHHIKCEQSNCSISPTFGYEGESARFCVKHKEDNMIDVRNKRCETEGCNIQPNYGYEGQKPQYCNTHKLDGMVDVKHKRCIKINCCKKAFFGYRRRLPILCHAHKDFDMIDVVSKRCKMDLCNIRPTFGYKGDIVQYCKCHKLDGMVDIKNKTCQSLDCVTRASYAKLYAKSMIHCVEHCALDEYSARTLNPICKYISCYKTAYFVDQDDSNIYPVRCNMHKCTTDIELVFKTCDNCREELYFPATKDICMKCGLYREKVLHHFKESMVKYFLQTNGISLIHDKRISPNGSRHRPDFLINSTFGYIIVEVDEHQHQRGEYTQEREIIRMKVLCQDIQLIKPNAQVLFIRFNPDEYEYEGVQQVLEERYLYLHTLINHFKEQSVLGMASGKLMLYYDGFTVPPSMEPIL